MKKRNKKDIKKLQQKLYEAYSKELCYFKLRDDWTELNKCYGMCAITALVVNDYFGGELCKMHVGDISHYFNIVNDEIVDLTKEQFEEPLDYSTYQKINKEHILTEETEKRYVLLKERLKS